MKSIFGKDDAAFSKRARVTFDFIVDRRMARIASHVAVPDMHRADFVSGAENSRASAKRKAFVAA